LPIDNSLTRSPGTR